MTRKQQRDRRRRRKRTDTVLDDKQAHGLGYHVVCLIDLLGQKEKLRRWEKLPTNPQITPEFIDAVRQTVGVVMTFRDRFLHFFDVVGRCTIPEKLAGLSKEQQERYHRLKTSKVEVERFSDTFVFSAPVTNDSGHVSTVPMHKIFGACCQAMLTSLVDGVPVRGAVTVGAGWVLDDGSFYGPALAEAHDLESREADYPRIVISPDAHGFISDGPACNADPEIARTMAQMARSCERFIWRDLDGRLAVDFLGEGMRRIVALDTKMADAVQRAYQFVCSEAARSQREGDTELAPRYERLKKYIESRLPLWVDQVNG